MNGEREVTKSKAAKVLGGNGRRAWHGLVVAGLSYLCGDEVKNEKPVLGRASAVQPLEAGERLHRRKRKREAFLGLLMRSGRELNRQPPHQLHG